jgi:diguanylate cyclase (GGDEF)-like protein
VLFGPTVARFDFQDGLQQQLEDFVERLINTDDLSGLFVRRKFDAELAQMIASAGTAPVGLLVMDLDGIKAINDAHGHLFGAYVIGEAGHVIADRIRGKGIGTRFGGDEFCAALPDHSTEQAAAVGTEILEAIRAHHFEKDGITLRPGISIGAASFPSCARDLVTLFQCADDAMYRAKRGGKNRVCT